MHYRGYSIEDLAENATFMEVAYLLVYGDLPDAERLEWFSKSISKHTLVHENMRGSLMRSQWGRTPWAC